MQPNMRASSSFASACIVLAATVLLLCTYTPAVEALGEVGTKVQVNGSTRAKVLNFQWKSDGTPADHTAFVLLKPFAVPYGGCPVQVHFTKFNIPYSIDFSEALAMVADTASGMSASQAVAFMCSSFLSIDRRVAFLS